MHFLIPDELLLKDGDTVGLGVYYPDTSEVSGAPAPTMAIAYVTVNRSVELTRVLHAPDAGYHPAIIMPRHCNT